MQQQLYGLRQSLNNIAIIGRLIDVKLNVNLVEGDPAQQYFIVLQQEVDRCSDLIAELERIDSGGDAIGSFILEIQSLKDE